MNQNVNSLRGRGGLCNRNGRLFTFPFITENREGNKYLRGEKGEKKKGQRNWEQKINQEWLGRGWGGYQRFRAKGRVNIEEKIKRKTIK